VAAKRSTTALAQFIAVLRADDQQILSDLHSRNVHEHDPEQIEDGKGGIPPVSHQKLGVSSLFYNPTFI